ncbi:hypothetical protein, variant 2 [Exophiala mesophila]|uniref:Zn(2)-C6 fungal-type domain-containing protein n=1 Tax=Exophiala mesophila TaxID=212818 RepID=A0A0D1XRY2_EXOME|nr:hypothetical protein, variant 2 [Exophiala mesophila]KIV90876.1 hypothetical protein, variant 2 [Exophiala mesophila]
MAQMADPREPARQQYPPPPEDPNHGGYYSQQSPRGPPPRDERNSYPPPDPARQGQYSDPRTHQYPPPQSWPGQHSAYPPPPPPPHHYPDPQHPGYSYPPPPRSDLGQPPQQMPPDPYRLPPPHGGYPYYAPPPQHYQPQPAAAPRQRTAIACKYCRKRKIRCSGYDNSPDGRCQNCVRFNQQCLFHPVSSQAAFVPASAVYGPGARAPVAGQSDNRPGQNGQQPYSREGDQPMLYGAHGQPLGPAGPHGQPQYSYPPAPAGHYPPPPQGYPYQASPYPPPPATASPYEGQGQAPPAQHDERSPHPNSRPRHTAYDSRANSSGSYEYTDPNSGAPTSPATSTMSYQAYPPQSRYPNGTQPAKGNASPPPGLTPQSAQSFNSPHQGSAHDDGRTPPPAHVNSATSSANGRSGMKVHEMLGGPTGGGAGERGRSDNEMLSKLDGKK